MSTEVEFDGFTITSSNPDADAVREAVDQPDPDDAAPAEPETERDAPAGSGDDEPAPEVDAAPTQERDERGKFRKGKASLQERLNHTVWEREEARRNLVALQAEVEQLRRAPAPVAEAPAPQGPPPGKPRLQDYDDHDQYVDDTVQWHLAEERQRASAVVAFNREIELRSTYADREAEFAAAVPDYRETMARVANVPITAALQQAILTSPRGPALAYFLAHHPEDATDLIAATRELEHEFKGQAVKVAPLVRRLLESKLPAAPATTGSGRGSRSVVPPPITPVGASPVVTDPIPNADLPLDLYIERENARELAERKRHRNLR